MTPHPDLNRSLKLFVQSELGEDDSPSLAKLKVTETEDMMELVDMLTPLLIAYRKKTVMLALAHLLSEQFDMIDSSKKVHRKL